MYLPDIHIGARVVADMRTAAKISTKSRNFIDKKIGWGTGDMATGAAMSRKEAIEAVESGIEVFEKEKTKNKINIIGLGEMGIANTTAASAALIAVQISSACKEYLFASHNSVEKGHSIALGWMGLVPMFDFDMRLGEGTGACLGISMIEAGVKIMTEMATFEDAKVSREK